MNQVSPNVRTLRRSPKTLWWFRILMFALFSASILSSARAEDVSAPALLQMFEAKWTTITDRQVDLFYTGYGGMWLPSPYRADSGDQSVGYDVYDRFDLGRPRKETLYGTETSFKQLVDLGKRAGVSMYPELILNHNGFSDLTTVDTQGTPTTDDDVTFAEAGGYPGFAVTLPGDIDGDFHGAFEGGDLNGRLSNLIDIAQEKKNFFIRHPVAEGNPDNIPAGTEGAFGRIANLPDPNNARFYPDQGLGGTIAYLDAAKTQPVTLYDFNKANPLAGDPVLEDSVGLLMRHTRWMVQEFGVSGFRVDAAKHFPTSTLEAMDHALHNSIQTPLLDGSRQHPFLFSEVFDTSEGLLQSYVRKDIGNDPEVIGGNRDVLDFPLFYALRDNLESNGADNNWHHVRGASQDLHDDGLNNGSQGVSFVDSHDHIPGGFPELKNVAYAYTLMRPGNTIVYLNAKEFGEGRDFPNDGKDDALGGFHGDAVTTLVELRNTHGRGNFHERWIDDGFNPNGFSNIYIYERENSAIVGLNSRGDSGYDQRSPQTGFAPGTVLVELTGNAEDAEVDPDGDIPSAIRVKPDGTVDLRVPRNEVDVEGNVIHDRGYVVYGLPTPEGTLSLTNVASTFLGETPTAATNGTARLGDVDVIRADSFDVQLATTPVTLPAPFGESTPVRDEHADGDAALLRIDQGMDLNNLAGVDHTTPGSVAYGFEEFTDTRSPGYVDDGNGGNSGTGNGLYVQTIDATQLSEGEHFITTRAFRHRDSGPAVFKDFKRAIYIDRLPPEAAIVSFEPFATAPENLEERDLIVQSVDGTADNMHIFLDLPANLTDAQLIAMALNGEQDAGQYDSDKWIFGFDANTTGNGLGVTTGNHVATVVTFERSFDGTNGVNVQRFAGLFTDTGVGAGFGDLDADGTVEVSDLSDLSNGSFEDVLYSQNSEFNAAADVDGDGDVDNLDLFDLESELSTASVAALDAYNQVLIRRGDLNGDTITNGDDVASLYGSFGGNGWVEDLNVDGTVNLDDVRTLVTDVLRTVFGDFDLDQDVDGADLLLLQQNINLTSGARFDQGDANLDGAVDADDFAIWGAAYGFQGPATTLAASLSNATTIPEPSTLFLLGLGLFNLNTRRISRGGKKR